MTGTILITGAGGYVGRKLAAALLAEGAPVLLWLHARDEAEAARKGEALRSSRALGGDTVRWAWGDLRQADPFAALDPAEIGAVVHAAAVIRFNVDPATAEQVNRDGTAKALAFAARCPGLDRFLQVSTLYAAGLGLRVPEEIITPEPEFANHYERSKWQAEALVARSALPCRIARLPTLIADDASGRVGQRNAFHNTLALFHHGLLPLLPGDAEARVPLATTDAIIRALLRLLRQDDLPDVVNLCPRPEAAVRLGALLDIAATVFAGDSGFRRRGVAIPPLIDRAAFALFAAGIEGLGPGIQAQALASLLPFAPQLYLDKEIATAGGRRACPDLDAADLATVVAATCRNLIPHTMDQGNRA